VILSSQSSSGIFGRQRWYIDLLGDRNGVNREFTIPGGEKAWYSPSDGIKVRAYHNTSRLQEVEFEAVESGGAGTGVDIIRLTAFAPPSRSRIFLDFIAL
jgi:hypothetical protein